MYNSHSLREVKDTAVREIAGIPRKALRRMLRNIGTRSSASLELKGTLRDSHPKYGKFNR
jgi:hypothetical protein